MNFTVVHEWLDRPASSGRVAEDLHGLFYQANLNVPVNFAPAVERRSLGGSTMQESSTQRPPLVEPVPQFFRFMPLAAERLNLVRQYSTLSSNYAIVRA